MTVPRLRGASLVLVVLVLVVAAAPAVASARPGFVPFAGAPVSDGTSIVAWRDGQLVHVVQDDEPMSGGVRVAVEQQCELGAVHATRLAFLCGGDDPKLYDLPSGQLADAPNAAQVRRYIAANRANDERYAVSGLGSRLLELQGLADKADFLFFDDLGAPRVFDQPRLSLREVVDLGRPTARRRLCSPLRVGTHLEPTYADPVRVRDDASYRPPYLVTLTHGHAVLRRCGSHRRLVLGRALAEPLLTRRYVAWVASTRLTVLFLRTRRRLSCRVARPTSGYVSPRLVGTDRRLWLLYGNGWRLLDLATPGSRCDGS